MITKEETQRHTPVTFEKGELFLKKICFPDTKTWTEDQFVKFNFDLGIVIGNRDSKKEYEFSMKIISVFYIREQRNINVYVKTGILLSRYDETNIATVISGLIDEANKNTVESPFVFITHFLQYDNEEPFYSLGCNSGLSKERMLE